MPLRPVVLGSPNGHKLLGAEAKIYGFDYIFIFSYANKSNLQSFKAKKNHAVEHVL